MPTGRVIIKELCRRDSYTAVGKKVMRIPYTAAFMAIICYPVLPNGTTKDEYQNPLIAKRLLNLVSHTCGTTYLTIWAGLPAMMLPTKALQ